MSDAITFKNVSRFGDLDLPLVGGVVAAGEEFEVTLDQARQLQQQPDLWEHVSGDIPAPDEYASFKVDELKQLLAARDLDTSGKKDELIARLEEADAAAINNPEGDQA